MSVFAELSPPYSTIVADPPWPMPETGKRNGNGSQWWETISGETVKIPYSTMPLQEIRDLPVADLAAKDAHLYLWTTNRFLEEAFSVARGWGFRPAQVLTWCKPPMGMGFGGAFVNTSEFVLFCRRGTLPALSRVDSTWWRWSRVYLDGSIEHSAKPDAFGDLVEQVSPGPYVELFCRRPRLGWDSWGHGYEIGATA